MAAQTVIRQSELLSQLVLDRDSMAELGQVDMIWMYPQAHRVMGFICKTGFLASKKLAFRLPQIKTIGINGILVSAQPSETTTKQVQQLESLLECEVWSDAGRKVGRIIDFQFNLQTGSIIDYLFTTNGLGGIATGVYRLPPSRVLSFGNGRVLVADRAIPSLQLFQEGLKQKIGKAGDVLKEDYHQATEEFQSLKKQAQSRTKQMGEHLQNLRSKAGQQAKSFTEQAKQQMQFLGERLRDGGQHWVDQVQETGRSWTEQLQGPDQNSEPSIDTHWLEEEWDEDATPPPHSATGQADGWQDEDWEGQAEQVRDRPAFTKTKPDSTTDTKAKEPPRVLITPPPISPYGFPPTPSSATPDADDDDPWI